MHADLPALRLGEEPGYTFKTLGAAFYALRQAVMQTGTDAPDAPQTIFRGIIQDIIFEGGDADTNAAPAAALLGAYLGMQALPISWIGDLHPQDKIVLSEVIKHSQDAAKRILRGQPS